MSEPSRDVVIRDCGPRDGLQGEVTLDVDVRLGLARDLASAGLRDIEAAKARIAAGTFGTCIEFGERIGIESSRASLT